MNIKNKTKQLLTALLIAGSMASCGDKFLDADIYSGKDSEEAMTSISSVGLALNGIYYRLCYYYFSGNYATMIGDIASDISYWNAQAQHFNNIYSMTYSDTESYLRYIWSYGYKVVDNSTRIINDAPALAENSTSEEKKEVNEYIAEAYALRAYAYWNMAQIYCHQIKVDGKDFSNEMGMVLVDSPVDPSNPQIKRATLGQTYDQIVSDLNNAIKYFDLAGGDRGSMFYMGEASTYGLLARVNLYLEDWEAASSNAAKAIEKWGKTSLTYTDAGYKALYNGGNSNTESLFGLAINASNSYAANSCGNLWSTYGFSPSPYCLSLYGENDVRKAIQQWEVKNGVSTLGTAIPIYKSGKFSDYSTGNLQNGTNYLINAPEMFLIQAESAVKSASGTLADAQEALLVVAKRNLDITSVSDLPQTKDELMQFIKEERARELIQEGHRLWDLRRWGKPANLSAFNAPNIEYSYENVDLTDFLFPIPAREINTGAGVEQNPNWASVQPH